MTLLDAPPAPPADPGPDGIGGGRRRGIRILAIVVAVVVVIAGATVAVIDAVDAAALAQVHVFLDGKPIVCKNPADLTTVSRGGSADDGDDSYAVPSVEGDLALDCTLSVIVRNDSDRDVDVQRITLPFLGPESRVGLHSDYSFTQGLSPHRTGADRHDVVYDFADDGPIGVGAGEVQRFRIHLTSDGCRQAGASTTFEDSPIVTTSVGLATADRPQEGAGFGFVGVKTSVQPCA